MVQGELMRDERGFSLIELLTVIAILGVLVGLSMGAYTIYRENAEYAKGDATMHQARTALYAGESDLPDGFTMAFSQSTTTGGTLIGAMGQAMPGAVMPKDLRLGVEINACGPLSGPFDREKFIVSEPCRAKRAIHYQRFCGGSEILLENVANPAPCT